MRLFDRYVLKIFVSASAVFMTTFVALFLVIDFASRASRFFSLQGLNVVLFIAQYYLIRLPVFLHHTLPMVTVFAAAFAMIKLTKNNELLPIVATGTSLRRVALPFLAAAIFTGAANAALEEWVLPDLTESLARTDEVLVTQKLSREVVAMGPRGTHVTIQEYDHLARVMHQVRLTKIRKNGRKELIVVAAQGEWNEDRQSWIFHDGHVEPFDENGMPLLIEVPGQRPIARKDTIAPGGYELRCDLTPRDLRPGFNLLGEFYRLHDLIAQVRDNPRVPWLKVTLHLRFSFPLSGLVLLLIGLPFVSATATKSFFRGLSLCFLVVIAFYAAHLVCLDMGQNGRFPPEVAAWGAVGLFGPIGLILFARMKT